MTELYEDVNKLEIIKQNVRLIRGDSIQVEKILDLINPFIRQKEKEISKIQDEHNLRALEDLIGRKI